MTVASARPMAAGISSLTVSVVIPAYTMKRWALLERAVESARRQTVPVAEVIICIDNNEELLLRCREHWAGAFGVPVRVVPNDRRDHLDRVSAHQAAHGTTRRFGAGSARNTAARLVASDIIAFMDDDATAASDWLDHLLAAYDSPDVVAVGGPPLPEYESTRPSWFPANFDWVFGCAYSGLPTEAGPLRHLIGANMSVRRDAWRAVGGFLGSDFDDLNLCMRLLSRYGLESVRYNPMAVVHHFVPLERLTWRYFWRRCYYVNREKVRVLARIRDSANLRAEQVFVWRAITTEAPRQLSVALRGNPSGLQQLVAMTAGIVLAGVGNLRGRLVYRTTASASRPPLRS